MQQGSAAHHRKYRDRGLASTKAITPPQWTPLLACEGHRYSSVTCPNRRSRCLSLNLPISKSVVRLNATEPAWPNTFHSPCARGIAAAGLGQSMVSPAAIPLSTKSKGNATKKVISATATLPIEHLNPGLIGPYRVHNSQV